MTNYTKITKVQLVGILLAFRGHCYLQLFATTPVRMNKGGRNHENYLFDNVVCKNEVNGSVDFIYENSKINAMVKDGCSQEEIDNLEIKDRKWGRHLRVGDNISRTIIVHEKDGETRFYVQMKLNTDSKQKKTPEYLYADTMKPLSDTDLATMYKYKQTKKAQLVEVRDYRVDNVDKIHINGTEYELVK